MSHILKDKSTSYATRIQRLAQFSPSYQVLDNFLKEKGHVSQAPTRFTIGTITSNGPTSNSMSFSDFHGTAHLVEQLKSPRESERFCRLFIVENLCADTITLLGEHFEVDPQFFADHLNNEPWYRIENVADRIPALPSSQKLQDHLQLRYIETMTIHKYQHSFQDPQFMSPEMADVPDASSDTKSFMRPDETTTRVPRKAGKLIPRVRNGRRFESILCTRQVITAWFRKGTAISGGWTGIVLVDPPFSLPSGDTYCKPTGYRSFTQTAGSFDDLDESIPSSNREAIAKYLSDRFTDNQFLLESAIQDCFLVLGDTYRLIASNWIVINEYVNRELATIEYILEKEEPGFRDLEVYLKDLYICRRRCTKYYDYISQAKSQCSSRGQQSWPQDNTSEIASDHAREIEGDFIYLQTKVQETAQRIEKNINLLTALVAIGEGKQGLNENHGIARLSLLAMVFLPFSTVAAILGIQGIYGPGADAFWLFWVVAIVLTVFILAVTALYDGIGRSIYSRIFRVMKSRITRVWARKIGK